MLKIILFGWLFASQNPQFDTGFLFEGIIYQDLFKQESVLQTETQSETLLEMIYYRAIPMPSDDSLDSKLLAEFKGRKQNAMIKTIGRPLFLMLMDFSVFGGGMHLLSHVMSDGANFATGIAGFVLLEVLQRHLSTCFNTVWYLWISPLGDPLKELEELYVCKKRFLNGDLQEKIERIFQDARKDDSAGSKKLFLENVLRLPVKSKQPSFSKNNINDLLNAYDAENIENIIAATKNHQKHYQQKNRAKTILYLQGPPGIGKTRLVQKLAESMELPLINLEIDNERFKSTAENPGTLFRGLCSQNLRNCFLFLDEFDRIANKGDNLNMLLPFTNPDTKEIFDEYIGACLDISQYFLILAGNNELNDSALLNRCEVVDIKGLKPQEKNRIIKYVILPELLNGNTLSETAETKVSKAIADDKDPGFRSIQKTLQRIVNLD